MATVKWIKITTDIFDDEKILLLEDLPEGDSIIVIWFKLLCLAGKMNNSGVFTLNDKIAYTDAMLATIFRRKEKLVRMALQAFEQFGMIEIVDGVITIPNWGKHQNIDQIESKREYMKNYMRDYREKQGRIACKTNSKTNSKTIGKANGKAKVSRADKEEDKDITLSLTGASNAPAPARESVTDDEMVIFLGEYGNVIMKPEEFLQLQDAFPNDYKERIDNLSRYMKSKGVNYDDHYATIMKWAIEDAKKAKRGSGGSSNAFSNYEGQREYTSEEYDELELRMRQRRTGDPEKGESHG